MDTNEMIDLHCHILPGLDDGPDTWDQAVEMTQKAVADGIHTLVATPHIHATAGADVADKIEARLAELSYHCTVLQIPLMLAAGGEVDAYMEPEPCRSFCLNDANYVLIEFPHLYLPGDAPEIIFNLVTAGLNPIIAHPERNHSVIKQPERLIDLTRSGALVQITGGSLLGEFGGYAKTCAEYLLKKGMVSFLASDAHSPFHRSPTLSSAVHAASSIIGGDAARSLVVANPEAVLAGRPLPHMMPTEALCLQSPF
jgi:protein-tyrosine phosphatase